MPKMPTPDAPGNHRGQEYLRTRPGMRPLQPQGENKMIIENIVCMIVGILIGYAGMYVADYKPTRIKELKSTTRTDNTSVIDALQKRIKELEATISKMETTQKWVSVKDRLPCEDGEYQVVYKHKNGALEASFDEWDNDCQDWMNATDRVAVVYWAELLPPPPTTEENK